MSKRAQWIERCLIDSPYHIGLCTTRKQFKNEMRRLKVPKLSRPDFVTDGKNGTVHQLQSKKGDLICIVCVDIKEQHKIEIIGLFIHEAVHVWQSIKEEIGDNEASKDFEAYSIQIIAQRLIDKYRKHQQ